MSATGATGAVGGAVAARLAAAGVAQRLVVRDPARVRDLTEAIRPRWSGASAAAPDATWPPGLVPRPAGV